MTPNPTPTRQLLEIRLGQDLAAYVLDLLEVGYGWRQVARALTEDTGMSVSHETLRSWFRDAAA